MCVVGIERKEQEKEEKFWKRNIRRLKTIEIHHGNGLCFSF